jgi:hypothetical protein
MTDAETVQLILGVIILLFIAVEVEAIVRDVARGWQARREKPPTMKRGEKWVEFFHRYTKRSK